MSHKMRREPASGICVKRRGNSFLKRLGGSKILVWGDSIGVSVSVGQSRAGK